MKVCVLLLLGSLVSASPADITLAWDYPTNELGTNLTFKIHSHTNVTAPPQNWAVTEVVGTAAMVRVTMVPERRFWFVTASNFWGETPPSNIADTPKPTTNVTGLKLTK